MKFRLVTNNFTPFFRTITKEDSCTIEAGSLVTLDSNKEAIPAVAASTAVAYTISGAVSGETSVKVVEGNDFELVGTADANFALTDKGLEVDITDAQLIDLGESTTDVLKVSIYKNAGTAGAKENVHVKINKLLF